MEFPLLIFTDLDGSLLDHHSYSLTGAEDALLRLHQLAIPLILTSSKTRAEIQKLQNRLGLHEAFITENGGGIFLPPGHPFQDSTEFEEFGAYRCKLFGRPYTYIREIFVQLQGRYNLKGFGDMSVEEIMQATGLNREEALLAGKRDFTEPFLFLADPRPREMKEEVASHGLTVTRGGRFYHLMSAGQDKGLAVAETAGLFQAECQDKIITVALGDAENDFAMLAAVDIPVLIPKPDGRYEDINLHGLRRAPYPGSKGWGAVVTEILDEFEEKYIHTGRTEPSKVTP